MVGESFLVFVSDSSTVGCSVKIFSENSSMRADFTCTQAKENEDQPKANLFT